MNFYIHFLFGCSCDGNLKQNRLFETCACLLQCVKGNLKAHQTLLVNGNNEKVADVQLLKFSALIQSDDFFKQCSKEYSSLEVSENKANKWDHQRVCLALFSPIQNPIAKLSKCYKTPNVITIYFFDLFF